MHLLRTRRGLLLGFVVLALVGAACGKAATASEGGGSSSGGGSGTGTGSSGGSGGSGYGAGGEGGMMATTVLEGPDNGFTFSPSTVKVTQGQTITLVNVSDAAPPSP
jgi:plastocyanin